ncbi:U-scoloptoxin(05)-Sm1a [Octopus sinensis]|uniref:U-scoloptoxin(05)-Sm1a n=1 Tax=Octopus sinensis TaxID=2607531 RepID=A0A6P7SVW8_9MOLL|nr:U-scoloptoxin(05)-Sm1a [Octopus sinensis]
MTQVKLQVLYFAMVHLLLLVSKVAGIRCVQCSSLKNPHCVSGKVPPSQCTSIDSGANFCVRYIGKLETGRIVYRDCSERDMGIRCMSKVTLNNETVRVCVTTCSFDGCNRESAEAPEFPASAQATNLQLLLLLLPFFVAAASMRHLWEWDTF